MDNEMDGGRSSAQTVNEKDNETILETDRLFVRLDERYRACDGWSETLRTLLCCI